MTEQQPAGRAASRASRARRSRAQGGGALTALLVAVGALVLAVTALVSRPALAGAVFVLQVVSVVGVFGMAGAGSVAPKAANMTLGFAAAAAVDASLLLVPDPASLRPLAAVLAGAFLVALLIQLARARDRSGVMPALASCLFAVVLVIMTACWLAGVGEAGRYPIVVTLAAAGVGALVEAALATIRAPAVLRALLTILLAAGAGAVAGVVSSLGAVAGVGAGFVAGLFAAAAFAVIAWIRVEAGGRIMVAVAVPLAAVAPPAYLLSRLLSG